MSTQEIMKNLEIKFGDFQKWINEDKRRKFYLGFAGIFIGIYALSFGGEKVSYVYKSEEASEFDSKNIIESPYKTIYDGKLNVLEETKDRLLFENRKLRDEIEGLKGDFKEFVASQKDLSTNSKIAVDSHTKDEKEASQEMVLGDSPISGEDLNQKVQSQLIKPNPQKKRVIKKRAKTRVVFPVKLEATEIESGVVIGAGSWAKGKIVAGAEIPQSRTYPVLIQLDQSYSMANQTSISLIGCLMIAKATPEMATRHIEIQPQTMACFSKNGQYFERKINGWGTDSLDNNFGVKGKFRSNIGRYAEYSFIKSLLDGVQEIVSRQSQQIGGQDPNRPDVLIQNGGAQTAGKVTEFLMKQAKQLLPTLEVSSGRDVYIVMKDSVRMPYEFFSKTGESNEDFNYSFDILR